MLPANTTLTNGGGTFSATLITTGTQSITVKDLSNGALTGSAAATVTPGLAVTFGVVAPSDISDAASFPFTVIALRQLR